MSETKKWLENVDKLEEVRDLLQSELQNIAEGYIVVGYLLKKTRDGELYRQGDFEDVFDFAKKTFNISRTWAIRFMQINDTYSIDGNSHMIQEKYRGYGSSKLSEMLQLPEEIRAVTPLTATVEDIRDVKRTLRDTEGEYDPQMSLCDVAQNSGNTEAEHGFDGNEGWMKKLVYHFFKNEGKSCFEEFFKWANSELEEGITYADLEREVMEIVAPTKFRMVRLTDANVLFSERALRVMPYSGKGRQEEFKYTDFLNEFEDMFFAENYEDILPPDQSYESVYGEPLKEAKTERNPSKVDKSKGEAEKNGEKRNKTPGNEGVSGTVGEKDGGGLQGSAEEDYPNVGEVLGGGTSGSQESGELSVSRKENEKSDEITKEGATTDFTSEKDNPTSTESVETSNEIGSSQVHEVTEDIVQEGESIEEILKSANLQKVKALLDREFHEPEMGWESWFKKVVKL